MPLSDVRQKSTNLGLPFSKNNRKSVAPLLLLLVQYEGSFCNSYLFTHVIRLFAQGAG